MPLGNEATMSDSPVFGPVSDPTVLVEGVRVWLREDPTVEYVVDGPAPIRDETTHRWYVTIRGPSGRTNVNADRIVAFAAGPRI